MNEEDLRVVKTRENITNQLIECLKEYSFNDISVKILIARARINRSTFYRNYADKYDLLDKLLTYLLDEFQKNIDARFVMMNYNNAKEYHPYIKELINYFWKHKDYIIILWNATLPVNLYNKMSDILGKNLLDTMITYYDVNSDNNSLAKLYSQLFAAQTMTTIRWWMTYESDLSYDEVIKIMINNVEKGLFFSMEDVFKAI